MATPGSSLNPAVVAATELAVETVAAERRLPTLPSELIDSILSHIDPSELQSTTLLLLYSLPNSQLSRSLLWKYLNISREGQAYQAIVAKRMDRELSNVATKSITLRVWRDDPQQLVNLAIPFTHLRNLDMYVGPLFEPDILEELLLNPRFKESIESIKFRFNPYGSERSYHTFLAGIYFDSTPLALAKWTSSSSLKRLSFIQDFPPMHGIALRETPAWGVRGGNVEGGEYVAPVRRIDQPVEKMDFAQPIIFFRLTCLTHLALSPVGSTLTHLTIRLPRRDVLPSLTSFPYLPISPLSRLRHLDLSTTHMISDTRLPLLLRLYQLEHLVLDRCSGLIKAPDVEEPPAFETLRWLGKCSANQATTRADEVMRVWKKMMKERPTGVPAPGPPGSRSGSTSTASTKVKRMLLRRATPDTASTSASASTSVLNVRSTFTSSLPPLVKDIVLIPTPSTLRSLCLGLYTLSTDLATTWENHFLGGYSDARAKTIKKVEDAISRWETARAAGKLESGEKKLVCFRDGWEVVQEEMRGMGYDKLRAAGEEEEGDDVFRAFCREKGLVIIAPAIARAILRHHIQSTIVFCSTPDISNAAGIPHMVHAITDLSSETKNERLQREEEIRIHEEIDRSTWRRARSDHTLGCGHLVKRDVEGEKD